MDIKATFDNEAEEYDFTSRAVNIYFDEALDTLVKNIKKGNENLNILDVCCGTGILTEKVAKAFPNAKFVGVDFSTGMLKVAKERMKNYDFSCVVSDVCDEEGMKDLGQFDLIISSFGLHNIHGYENKQKAFTNILQHLKKGGQFITCDLIKGKDEEEEREFFNFQREWLLKTYDEKQTEEWLTLLAEEDEPETLERNFALLKTCDVGEIQLVWQKVFLGIWTGVKE